jgi:hypothetical protein
MSQIENRLAADPVIQAMLQSLARGNQEREVAAAKADPLTHKFCRIFPKGVDANYRYCSGGMDGRHRKVHYCYSVNRNVAGFYLGWREVVSKKQVKRDCWIARRKRWKVTEIAEQKAEAARARWERFQAQRTLADEAAALAMRYHGVPA